MSIDGRLLTTYDGVDEATWLDTDQIVLSTWQRRIDAGGWEIVYRPNGVPASESFVAVVSSGELEPAGTDLAGAISDNDGVFAVPRCSRCNPNAVVAQSTFAIWTHSGGESPEVSGIPVRWSVDGSFLLVEHPAGDRPSDIPGESIVSVPGLTTEFTVSDSSTTEPDPFLRQVLSVRDGEASTVDLATGLTTPFGPVEDPLLWNGTEQLIALDYNSKAATVFTLDGTLVAEYPEVGDHVHSSLDGTTHAFWHFDQRDGPNALTVLRRGTRTRLETPGLIVGEPVLSKDGSSIAVIVQSDLGDLDVYITGL